MTDKKDLKPCIHCDKECEYYYIQLGDEYSAFHLRVCSNKCLVMMTLEFLREVGEYKNFKYYLQKMELEEDRVLREKEYEDVCARSGWAYSLELLKTSKAFNIYLSPEER